MRKNNKDGDSNITTSPSISSTLQKLRSLITREEKFKCLGIAGFALCSSLFEVITASVIVVFAQVLNQPEIGQKYLIMAGFSKKISPGQTVLYIAIFVGVIYLIKNLIAAAEVFYQHFSIQKMSYHFKNKLLNRYAEADYGFYLTRNSSLGLAVVGSDAEIMFSGGMISIATILSESIVFLCLISMVVFMNPSLALVIFSVGAVIGMILTKGLLPQFYRWGQRMQDAVLFSNQNLLQFFHGFKEIILLGKREYFINAYRYYSRKKSRILASQNATNALPRMIIEVLFIGLFIMTIAYLCLEQESPVQMIGILGGYLYVGFRLMPGLNRIINQLNVFKAAIPSIERVYKEYNMIGVKENYVNIPDFTFESSISLIGLTFRYQNTENDALKELSFSIKKGECIGIVGETGSGKSTLVDVILGLLKPQKGSLLIDGKFPVNSYQWHQKIGYVPQSIYLTDDTIEANIAFGENEIDAVRINAAIDAAQLRKFVSQLPQGSHTLVGERGVRLSGGERQRVAIARALYHNPEVLIFDEATSALDNETEAKVMETISEVSKDRTVIMIAHRLSTLKNCDRIVEIVAGGVREELNEKVLKSEKGLR